VAVEQDFHALPISSAEDAAREELAIDREKKRVIPQDYADLELGPVPQQPFQ
jgi:hypothetical protein